VYLVEMFVEFIDIEAFTLEVRDAEHTVMFNTVVKGRKVPVAFAPDDPAKIPDLLALYVISLCSLCAVRCALCAVRCALCAVRCAVCGDFEF
jgi:hypothetical protein